MINFAPEDDERLLVDSARAFALQQLKPKLRVHEEARALPAQVREAFHALGLVGLDLPEALGFGGLSLTARALIEEELAAGDLGASFALDAVGLGGQLISALGSADQQARWLKPFLDQPLFAAACALSEKSAGADLACIAVREGGSYLLQGEKRHALGAARAELIVVLAQLEAGQGLAGAAAFVLERKALGESVRVLEDRDPLGLAELPPCTVTLEGVRVPAEARLGEGDLRPALRAALLRQAAVAAARAVGASRAAFEVARRYAEERSAFGKPIGHFQAIAFLLADMATELEGARALLWRGCRAHDLRAPDAELRLAQAVAQAHEASFFITNNAVQVLGGAGYVQDHPVEKWMRDARALALYALPTEAAQAIAMEAQLGVELQEADALCFCGPQPAST